MRIPEAPPKTVARIYVNRWETWTLWDISVNQRLAIQAGELWSQSWHVQ